MYPIKVLKSFLVFSILILLLFSVSCNSTSGKIVIKSNSELKEMEANSQKAAAAFRKGNYKDAEKILLELVRENTVSRPLYLEELASVYIAQGRNTEAKKTLMDAQAQLEILFDPDSEKKASSLFGAEVEKIYKGDPYERISLYALLALLFLEEGDVDNALACCKSGLLQDADSSKEIFSSDCAMLQFLAYVCYRIRNDDEDADRMEKALYTALSVQPQSPIGANKALSDNFNALLVFWNGLGPSITALGEYKEKRIIAPGTSSSDYFAVVYDNNYIDSCIGLGDVSFQATTRGGRLMDNILSKQAAIKHGTKITGNVLLAGGLAMLPSMAASPIIIGPIALGLITTGGIIHGVGYAMNSEADTRYWKNLPDDFIIVPVNLPPGENKLRLLAFNNSEYIDSFSFTVKINPDIPINISQVILNDIGSDFQKNNIQTHMDYPLIFSKLILKDGCSAVFTEEQVNKAKKELYKEYNVKDDIWPKEVLYYVQQEDNYPATSRLSAWNSIYTSFCEAILANNKEATKK